MIERFTGYALFALGAGAVIIGLMMFTLGSNVTGNIFGAIMAFIAGVEAPVEGLSPPNVDSELRFYAVFWVACGILLCQGARALEIHFKRVQLLLGLFFLGGVGRVLSLITIGTPHPLFVTLMGIELVLPVVLFLLLMLTRRTDLS